MRGRSARKKSKQGRQLLELAQKNFKDLKEIRNMRKCTLFMVSLTVITTICGQAHGIPINGTSILGSPQTKTFLNLD